MIIHIGISDSARERETSERSGAHWLNGIMAPVRTVLHVRDASGSVMVHQTQEWARLDLTGRVQFVNVEIAPGKVPFVLGWLMSESARTAMRRALVPAGCRASAEATNECGLGRIVGMLGGKD